MVFGLGLPGYLILPESATKVIDEVRNQGLGPKLVGKQTITFWCVDYHRIVQGPDSKNGTTTITFPFCGIGPRSSMRVKRHIWTINVRVGPGHRPRLNSYLSFSMARSTILEFIFPRCYFPCVPGSPQRTATPTYAVRLDPSCALSHRVSTFFHIWFSQTKYFNSVPLISTRWIKGGRLVS